VLTVPDSANKCPLCQSNGDVFYHFKERLYHQCNNCYGIFVDESLKTDGSTEKQRYEEHNNDIKDVRYQQFVAPITTAIMESFTPDDRGLDFGAGTGPVISKVLTDNDFSILQYDPFFHDYPELLKNKYDYIACCEVIEHFYAPYQEFQLLKSLLNKDALLYCMTDLYDSRIDFHKWYYKNDLTHVFIYQQETLHWVKEEFGFSDIEFNGRLITFSA
jgi:Methyltransferase domain/Transcription factor zinc-finger